MPLSIAWVKLSIPKNRDGLGDNFVANGPRLGAFGWDIFDPELLNVSALCP